MKLGRLFEGLFACVVTATLLITSAYADPVFPATTITTTFSSNAPCCSGFTFPADFLATHDPTWDAFNFGIVTTAPVNLQASASTVSGAFGHGVLVSLTYYLFVGGTPGTSVPLNVQTNLSSSAHSDGGAEFASATAAVAILNNSNAEFGHQSTCVTGSPNCIPSFNGTFRVTVPADQILKVLVQASAGTLGDELVPCGSALCERNPLGGFASASADPYLFLDQDFLNQGYTLFVSPNVANGPVSATPLPAALPLFATGLGALGLLGWRRKKKLPTRGSHR